MGGARRKRHDPRREATRAALIEAAESLFAESSVESVSTRSIGTAIGSANANVVAYHFGGKDELIKAVFRHRLPEMDKRRGGLLDAADTAGTSGDLTTLVRIFFLPFLEQTDSEGRHSYARFVAGMERSGLHALRGELLAEFPETNRLNERIATLLPEAYRADYHLRQRLAVSLMSTAFLLIDRDAGGDPEAANRIFETGIAMASVAMAAPLPDTNPTQP
ncbi:MAG: TetR family transcriptional regulator [Novosphingobium sp.]|nr:TetR family transcriptional regulator [Novosphingobium sp.]